MDLEMVVIDATVQPIEKVGTRPTQTIAIRHLNSGDRRQLRIVLNGDVFKGRIGIDGSTEDSRVIVYYNDYSQPFEGFFAALFDAVTTAFAVVEPARAH